MLTISIQAGGLSKRMGQNKALMYLDGMPLIQRIMTRVKPVASEVNVISSEKLLYDFLQIPIYPDEIPGIGVLGGVYTALLHANCPFVAAVGCDLPFISSSLLIAEVKMLEQDSFDVVIPESDNGLEPLNAVYRKAACLPAVQNAVLNGDRRIISWFDQVKVKTLHISEVNKIDPSPYKFFNINNFEDFNRAEKLIADEKAALQGHRSSAQDLTR